MHFIPSRCAAHSPHQAHGAHASSSNGGATAQPKHNATTPPRSPNLRPGIDPANPPADSSSPVMVRQEGGTSPPPPAHNHHATQQPTPQPVPSHAEVRVTRRPWSRSNASDSQPHPHPQAALDPLMALASHSRFASLPHNACVWLLGDAHLVDRTSGASITSLMRQFQSIPLFSYRRDFAPIAPTRLTSDIGWGCMLRTTQMMLGTALLRHALGRAWCLGDDVGDATYGTILRWFCDNPMEMCSVHTVAQVGAALGKPVGHWFGPTTGALVAQQIVHRNHARMAPVLRRPLRVYVGQQASVVAESVRALFAEARTSEAGGGVGAPAGVLVLVPVMLGVGVRMSPEYRGSLAEYFKLPQFVGLVGGKPKASYYFVGMQGDNLLYLDPHAHQQPAMVWFKERKGGFEVPRYGTIHETTVRMMPTSELDPSAMFAFYCQSPEDFETWRELIEVIASRCDNDTTHNDYPHEHSNDQRSGGSGSGGSSLSSTPPDAPPTSLASAVAPAMRIKGVPAIHVTEREQYMGYWDTTVDEEEEALGDGIVEEEGASATTTAKKDAKASKEGGDKSHQIRARAAAKAPEGEDEDFEFI